MENLEGLMNIIDLMKNNSGNKLQEIIEENSGDELFLVTLQFLYNPYITTGLSTKKINKEVPFYRGERIKDLISAYKYLKNNNTGRDEDISAIQDYMMFQNQEYKETLKQIFTKELKLGITSKTINKVIPNFIPEFNVMLAEKYSDRIEELEKNKPNIILTQKLDGIRAVLIVENGNTEFFTRQGKKIEGLIEIEEEAKRLPDGAYDGELLANISNLKSKDLYRETVSRVNSKDKEKTGVEFNVFDFLSVNEFVRGFSSVECYDRKTKLESLINSKYFKFIKTVPMRYVGEYNNGIVSQFLQIAIENNEEGLMLNYANAPYTSKRNKYILKVKKMYSMDLKVVDMEEGTGQNKGKLGAVIVEYKGNKVGVGSGFTLKDREEVWANKDKYLGKIVEVQFFEISQDKNGNESLRFPCFIQWRFDKTEESYF